MSVLLCGEMSTAARDEWLTLLRAAAPDEDWIAVRGAAADARIDVAVVANPPRAALQGLPALRLVQSLWAGVEGLLADPTLPDAVPLARMVDPVMTDAMVETALWAVLSLQRDFFAYARQQRRGEWRQLPQRRASEWPVLVLGLGEIGGAVARRLAAHGYPVRGWSRSAASISGVDCCCGEAALDGALGSVRVVVNLLPLTASTRGFFDGRRLAAMRRGAHLVNLARGGHLVDADVIGALEAGQLGELVADAFAVEPLPAEHPFWRHPRVFVLPHIAAQTDKRSAAAVVAANIARLRSGQAPLHQVDKRRGY